MAPVTLMAITHRKYLLILSVLFLVLWAALAIKPLYRDDWMVENFLVVVFAVLVWAFHRKFPFSREAMGSGL